MCYKGVMNRSAWRFFLTCFLLAALPVKGFAAASMLACGPNHHRSVDSLAHHGTSTGPATHAHGSGITHQHLDDTAGQPGSQEPGLASGDPSSDGSSKPSSGLFKCGGCAPCCAGAALTSTAATQFAAPVGDAEFPVSATLHASAPFGRLDRPPRNPLA